MKNLGCRAIMPVALAVTGFVIVCCVILYSAIKSDMTDLEVRHATDLASTVVKSTRHSMLKADREALANIIADVGEHENVEHVRIYNKKGVIVFSRDEEEINQKVDKTSAGCIGCHSGSTSFGEEVKNRQIINEDGRDVFAISAPIFNELGCSVATCHSDNGEQRVLGIMELQLSRSPVTGTLALLRNRMVLFTLMVLFLTVGGVAAILNRNVFLPVKRLAVFTEKLVDGNIEPALDETGCELDTIAENARILSTRLKDSRAEIVQMEKLVCSVVPGACRGDRLASGENIYKPENGNQKHRHDDQTAISSFGPATRLSGFTTDSGENP